MMKVFLDDVGMVGRNKKCKINASLNDDIKNIDTRIH